MPKRCSLIGTYHRVGADFRRRRPFHAGEGSLQPFEPRRAWEKGWVQFPIDHINLGDTRRIGINVIHRQHPRIGDDPVYFLDQARGDTIGDQYGECRSIHWLPLKASD